MENGENKTETDDTAEFFAHVNFTMAATKRYYEALVRYDTLRATQPSLILVVGDQQLMELPLSWLTPEQGQALSASLRQQMREELAAAIVPLMASLEPLATAVLATRNECVERGTEQVLDAMDAEMAAG